MARITEPRVVRYECSLFYAHAGQRSAGFAFDCDQDGNVFEQTLTPLARANLEACRAGVGKDFEPPEIHTSRSIFPAVLRCDCGAELALTDPLTNECACGRLFNMGGQELAPREHWEERVDDDY